tara:strand:+ start:30438 stop:31190 length:753 start_codon:yes stop_codon:yes gene_type:complete
MLTGSLLAASVLFVVSIGTALLSTATGMGGGVLFFLTILHFFPLAITIPIHGFVQMFANIMRTFSLRTHLRRAMCAPYLVGAVAGVLCVLQVLEHVQNDIIPYSIILALIIYSVFKPSRMPDLKIPLWSFGIVGFFAGFLAILIGAVDPFLSPFFIRDDFSKEEVVANKSFMQAVIHVAKVPVFLHMGFSYGEHALVIALLIAGSFLGIFFGVRALSKINRRVFLISFKTILFLVGIRISVRLFTLVTQG